MILFINGQQREFPDLALGASLAALIAALGFKNDRVAIEHNGAIAARTEWESGELKDGDKLEIVHYVGGGRH